jgi:hypothetical protein
MKILINIIEILMAIMPGILWHYVTHKEKNR